MGIEPEASRTPDISVLLSCLEAGFFIFFFLFLLVVVQTALSLQCPFLPPPQYFTPLFLEPQFSHNPPSFFFFLLCGIHFVAQNWLKLSLNFLDGGKLDWKQISSAWRKLKEEKSLITLSRALALVYCHYTQDRMYRGGGE